MQRRFAWLVGLLGLALVGAGLAMWFWPPRLPSGPDYFPLDIAGLRLWARADQAKTIPDPQGGSLKVVGTQVVLWIESPRELGPVLFQVRGRLERVEVRSASKAEEFEPPPVEGEARFFLEWQPEKPRRHPDRPGFFYELTLSLSGSSAELPATGDGTSIALIGSRAHLDRDLYSVEWLGCGAPEEVLAGEEFLALARMKNTSAHAWPHQGNARVRLAARWKSAREESGPRADLEATVESGDEASRWLAVRAPDRPGRHILELDLFHQPVASFSSKRAPTCQAEVLVR